MFPLEKYKYYTDGKKKVVAVQTFAGKEYSGVAVCADQDKFDLEKGKKLAAYRCSVKICAARSKYADNRFYRAQATYAETKKELISANNYAEHSYALFNAAKDELESFLKGC